MHSSFDHATRIEMAESNVLGGAIVAAGFAAKGKANCYFKFRKFSPKKVGERQLSKFLGTSTQGTALARNLLQIDANLVISKKQLWTAMKELVCLFAQQSERSTEKEALDCLFV